MIFTRPDVRSSKFVTFLPANNTLLKIKLLKESFVKSKIMTPIPTTEIAVFSFLLVSLANIITRTQRIILIRVALDLSRSMTYTSNTIAITLIILQNAF